jgi:hypothetical protein
VDRPVKPLPPQSSLVHGALENIFTYKGIAPNFGVLGELKVKGGKILKNILKNINFMP